MRAEERALAAVPRWLWTVLAIATAVQIAWQSARPGVAPPAGELPPQPRPAALRLAAFGEPQALARIAMLYVQAFQSADTMRVIGWLNAIIELDPRSQYPLFAAARIYAETADPARARAILEFVYREFVRDPNRRWPWLAHAALLAKHRLGDLALARRYAAAIDRLTTAPDVPLWAKQMEIFILEDMNELEAARIMVGGLLASGAIRDPAELRFLKERLEALEARSAK